jgi:hypothetical protein
MDMFGIDGWFLFVQGFTAILFIGLPIIALIDLAKKKMSGTTLALWVLIICVIPALGAIAYWIVKPTPESKI